MRDLTVLTAISITICAAWLLSGCTLAGLVGSGRGVTRDMPLSNFTAIDASSAFQLDVKQGDGYAVSVTADDNLWDQVEARVDGQTLHLGLKPGTYTNAHLRASITMPALAGVTLSGASHATLAGFAKPASQLAIRCSGASSLDGEARGDNATFDLSGASKVTLRGAASTAQVTAGGASSADLSQFPADKANVQLSGASRAVLNVTSNLDYDLSGASNLEYSGNPSIGKSQSSGASNVRRR